MKSCHQVSPGQNEDDDIYARGPDRRVLLVEPAYSAKYPPLGLMKISTFHRLAGDGVYFVKGTSALVRDQPWDVIYITTMFTYNWKVSMETIKFYQRNRWGNDRIKVGGIMASLMAPDIEAETGIRPHVGLWHAVDRLPPDYSLVDGLYNGTVANASIGYMTKGCINHCPYCAVPCLEPEFVPFIPLGQQIDGNRKDLILLDNNVLASPEFPRVIEEIKSHGFQKGARRGKAQRFVDFNQGIDARLLSEEKMELLSQLAIKPLRIAFDNIRLEKLYTEKIRLAHKHGVRHLSNYILFNFDDTPDDFYRRLQINIELNEELGLSIFSFPMKYVPLNAKDRKHVGPNWTKTQLRGIQCILHATHGVVGPRRPFFEAAFGRNVEEFKHIIEQPEEAIFHREKMNPFREHAMGLLAVEVA